MGLLRHYVPRNDGLFWEWGIVNAKWEILIYWHTAKEEENGRGVRDTGIYNYTFFGGEKTSPAKS